MSHYKLDNDYTLVIITLIISVAVGIALGIIISQNHISTHQSLDDIIYKQCYDAVDKSNCIKGYIDLYRLNPDKFMRDWDR